VKAHLLSTDKEMGVDKKIDPSEKFVTANCGRIMKFTRAPEFYAGEICERCRELDKGKNSIFTFMIIEICTLHIPDHKLYRTIKFKGQSFKEWTCKLCEQIFFLPEEKTEQNAIQK